MASVTLRERCFTPCPAHSPDWTTVEGAVRVGMFGSTINRDTPNVVVILRQLSASPDTLKCVKCSALTLEEARRYARSVAHKHVGGIPDVRGDRREPKRGYDGISWRRKESKKR